MVLIDLVCFSLGAGLLDAAPIPGAGPDTSQTNIGGGRSSLNWQPEAGHRPKSGLWVFLRGEVFNGLFGVGQVTTIGGGKVIWSFFKTLVFPNVGEIAADQGLS